jgi:hypothetical protein
MGAPVYRRSMGYVVPYRLINGVMFNITWFAIVITQSAVLAPVLAASHLLIHFFLMGRGAPELKMIAVVTVFGLVLDQLLFLAGVFTVDGNAALPPIWMACIWPVLATTFMHAFSGLRAHFLLASVFGAIGAAASFVAGTRLTDVAFGSELYGPLIMAIVWAALFPLLLKVAALYSGAEGQVYD